MVCKVESRLLGDVVVLVPNFFRDDRGFFIEAFREEQFKAFRLPHQCVPDNHSHSTKGVPRGLRFRWDPSMGKLMRVSGGERSWWLWTSARDHRRSANGQA